MDRELADFCEAEHRRLVGMLALYVGDVHVAEELAQDALVRVCQHWPRVRRMAEPRAWLTKVALNLARSMFRRRAAAQRAMTRHGADVQVHRRDDVTVIAVRTAVAALPRRMRHAVVLRHFAGLSVHETADVMGCAEGTVKSLTSRAIEALRTAGLHDDPTDPNHKEALR